MVIGMASILKGHREILVGNVIGADILNVLFVVGASAIAAPLPLLDPAASVPNIALLLHIPVMLAILVLFRIFIHGAGRTGTFRRWQGIPLVVVYVVYAGHGNVKEGQGYVSLEDDRLTSKDGEPEPEPVEVV